MGKSNVCYKVVNRDLQSCVALGKSMVEYKLNEWVEAPEWLSIRGHHLFCFERLKEAKAFYSHIEDHQIYLAEYEDKVELPEMAGLHGLSAGRCEVWRGAWRFPVGTMCVKKLKLIKRVK